MPHDLTSTLFFPSPEDLEFIDSPGLENPLSVGTYFPYDADGQHGGPGVAEASAPSESLALPESSNNVSTGFSVRC